MTVETADRPFALPNRKLVSITLDLPFPPTTNTIWRHAGKKVYRSAPYMAWLAQARNFCIYLKQHKQDHIEGAFAIEIVLDRNERRRAGDLDNRIKPLLDLCQSWELIRNDRDCDRLVASWGMAPHGCRLLLTELA